MWMKWDPKQLNVGHYVRIEHRWFSHPFPRSTFHIGSRGDIDLILQHGLKRISIDPERTLQPDTQAAPPTVAAVPAPLAEPAVEATATISERPVPAGDASVPVEEAAATSPAANKAQRLVEVARQRQNFEGLSQHFVLASRQCERAIALIGAGDRAGLEIVEGIVDGLVESGESEFATLSFAGTVVASAALATPAAQSFSAVGMAVQLGKRLQLGATQRRSMAIAAALHGIGLLRIVGTQRSARTIGDIKPWDPVYNYPGVGAELLRRLDGLPEVIVELVMQHRECLDGSGFPLQLRGGAVPLEARILGLIHEYQELTSPDHQPQRQSPSEAVRTLYLTRRQQLGADAMDSFISVLSVYPPGTIIQLSDDSTAVVLRINPKQRLRPTLLILDDKDNPAQGDIIDLALSTDLSITRALPAAQLPPVAASFLGFSYAFGLTIEVGVADVDAA